MKKVSLWIALALLMLGTVAQAQTTVKDKQINELVTALTARGLSKDDIKEAVNAVIQDPDLYNKYWKKFVDNAMKADSGKWKFLKDLNIDFKTFEAQDADRPGLGFSYDFNYSYAKFTERDNKRTAVSFDFAAKGNVAFKKELNPNNLLEAKVFFNWSRFTGGVVKIEDAAYFSKLDSLDQKLIKIKDPNGPEAAALWKQFGKSLQLSNQYYYGFSPEAGFESNQDFSKTQFTPGIVANLGAKAWDDRKALAWLNVLDYPFAAIRYVIGTDHQFTPYGATLPTVQTGISYVLPTDDKTRQSLLGNKDPFPRFKFEASFRTFISRIEKQNIFFSANYRYYKELGAKDAIVNAHLDNYNYLVMAVQSSGGLFASYSAGNLPFDAKKDQVYAIGFNYKF